jgi:hypothetical protein
VPVELPGPEKGPVTLLGKEGSQLVPEEPGVRVGPKLS